MNTTAKLFILLVCVACSKDPDVSAGGPAGSVPKTAPASGAARVEVAVIAETSSTRRFVRPGEVRGAREADLASSLGGLIEAVRVDDGQRVKAGTAIAFVDTSVHNARAKLTKVEVDEAKRELARLEGLGKAMAAARVDQARSRVDRALAQHDLSRANQSRAVIRAPFAGVLSGLTIERGEVVAPGAPVAKLVQVDPVHVAVSVADRDVGSLALEGAAEVATAGSAQPLPGTIVTIEPVADPRTRTFVVEVEVDNSGGALFPGMIATVTFAETNRGGGLLLPQDLIVTQLKSNGVFVVADGNRAEWRTVKLGRIIGTEVEVVAGVTSGESIVSRGHRSLVDGDELLIARKGRCCENGRILFESEDRGPAKKKPGEEDDT